MRPPRGYTLTLIYNSLSPSDILFSSSRLRLTSRVDKIDEPLDRISLCVCIRVCMRETCIRLELFARRSISLKREREERAMIDEPLDLREVYCCEDLYSRHWKKLLRNDWLVEEIIFECSSFFFLRFNNEAEDIKRKIYKQRAKLAFHPAPHQNEIDIGREREGEPRKSAPLSRF